MSLQHMENIDKKHKIGAKAASLVSDGETIILDARSTTTEVAHNLAGRASLTIITNALNIALMLGAQPGHAVHMPGGQFKAPTLSLSGDKAADYFRDVYAGKLLLATAGVALDTRAHLSELRRFAAQAGHDRRRLAGLSRGRFNQDQPLIVRAAWHARRDPLLHHRRRHPR
jgi:DeoR/GlpR family transcriptional regulator of sugar metabolism